MEPTKPGEGGCGRKLRRLALRPCVSSMKLRSLIPRMKLNPCRPFRAYLFDCDGTIADSMPLHYIAWKKAWRSGTANIPRSCSIPGAASRSGRSSPT
jgi:hypothetical protein